MEQNPDGGCNAGLLFEGQMLHFVQHDRDGAQTCPDRQASRP
jgi:hypothetical protein